MRNVGCTCGASSPRGDRPLSSTPSVTLMDTSTAEGELGWLLDPEDGVSARGGKDPGWFKAEGQWETGWRGGWRNGEKSWKNWMCLL